MRQIKLLFRMVSLVALCLVLILPLGVRAEDLPGQLLVDGQTLYLNGQGPRKKAFLTVYDIGLYMTERGSDAQAIIKADHPMAFALAIRSLFVTPERISKAFYEGLQKSTGGNLQPIQEQIDRFLAIFKSGVEKNDLFQFVYIPGTGVTIYRNEQASEPIEGLEFKRALFGIWLSDAPVSIKLKSQLLGK